MRKLSLIFFIVLVCAQGFDIWNFMGTGEAEIANHPKPTPSETPEDGVTEDGTLVNYYIPMLRDHIRNRAFRGAIENAIAKLKEKQDEIIVLDIGAGQGLLSLLAARAGATHIYGIEKHKTVASIAQEIIKLNGYEDKITLINKHSYQLTIGDGGDLPRKADILLSENLDSYFFGERMLPTVKHAREHLLVPDAQIVPCGGSVYVQFIESNWGFSSKAEVEGFNFEPFRHYRLNTSFSFDFLRHPHVNITAAHRPFQIDFEKDDIMNQQVSWDTEALATGAMNAAVVWWHLDVDKEFNFWMGPDKTTHWEQGLVLLSSDILVKKGDKLKIDVSHDMVSMTFSITKH